MIESEHIAAPPLDLTVATGHGTKAPLVSVIVVNYNGEGYLRSLLPSLFAQTYPHVEIVIVDNASSDSSLEYLRSLGQRIRTVPSPRNLGFAGGNNLGIAAARGTYFALINSDTVADPRWLEHLVRELEGDKAVGAVGPKITFLKPYLRFTFRVASFRPSDHGHAQDERRLGLCLDEDTKVEGCTYRKPIFRAGFGGTEALGGHQARWSGEHGEVLLPFEGGEGDKTLLVIASGGSLNPSRIFTVELEGRMVGTGQLTGDFAEHRFVIPADVVSMLGRYAINNAGSALSDRGVAGDRGIFALDEGQYDRAEDVTALCGCSMLIRRDAFEEVGGFDSSFFMYFEDVDLSWRLRRRGFRLRYQPASVIRHVHAGTSSEGSPLFVFFTARNRLMMLLKNAPWSSVIGAWGEELRHTASLTLQVLRAARIGSGRRVSLNRLRLRLRILASALFHSPAALIRRWRG